MTAPTIPSPVLLTNESLYRTPVWYEARQRGITATDIAKIAGLHPYGSAWEVYQDKIGDPLPDDAGEAAEIGHLLEPVIAEEWARRHSRTIVPAGLYGSGSIDWMLATPDRLVLRAKSAPTEPAEVDGPLEVKTALGWIALDWDGDVVPDQHMIQLQWQMAVLGSDRGFVACLAGPSIKSFEVDRDQEYIDDLIAIAERFRHDVEHRIPPPPEGSDRLAKLLSKRWKPEPDKVVVLDPATFREAQRTYWAAHNELEEVKARKVAAGNTARVLLGDAEAAVIDGEVVATWKAGKTGTRTLNIKKAKP